MTCDSEIDRIKASEFSERIRAKAQGAITPLSGSFEWTLRCNLACQHCYARCDGRGEDLPTERIKGLLRDLAELGVLFLTVTGGEPLVRNDFKELYQFTKEQGFVVSLFTNATLLDDDTVDFLADLPPRRVEVSMYGASEDTYEQVTGVKGSYRAFRRGVGLLLKAGITVNLKAMLLTLNVDEFERMKQWAVEELDVPFRYDAIVHPRLNGDASPLEYRLPPEKVVELQYIQSEDREKYAAFREQADTMGPRERFFECGAGRDVIHVDAQGQAHPCMQWRFDPYDTAEKPLREGWKDHVRQLLERDPPPGDCISCDKRQLCSYCPALAQLEKGHPAVPSVYFCALADERIRRLNNNYI
jgi:MoaA/NifB/PqqE/SkfB family radical SAM enzyme